MEIFWSYIFFFLYLYCIFDQLIFKLIFYFIMKHLHKRIFSFVFLLDQSQFLLKQMHLSIQGVLDLDVPSGGSDGKAIHLVATEDIADLSIFGLGVANNGNYGSDGMEYSLDAVPASNGDDILIARSVEAMSAYFADCYTEFEIIMIANSNISQNGDDAIELFEVRNGNRNIWRS